VITELFGTTDQPSSTVLCLHGADSSSTGFTGLAELSDRFRIVAWDAPGYRGTPAPTADHGLSGYAQQLIEQLATISDQPVHVLGTGLGGALAMQLALDAPDLVKSLILADSAPGLANAAEVATAMQQAVATMAEQGAESFAQSRPARLVSDSASPQLLASVGATIAADISPDGYQHAVTAFCDADLAKPARAIHKPTVVLCGDADTVIGLEQSQNVSAAIPNAVLVTLSGAGHLAHVENPHAFNAWVRSFLYIIDNVRESTNG
jgi:3-oxoadipate enol-lactonase